MKAAVHPPSSVISRRLIGHEAFWLPVIWGLFALGVVVLTMIVSFFRPIGANSTWEAAAFLPRWYMLGIGAFLMAFHLPLHIAHGFTRREFMSQALIYMLAMVSALSVLMTLGYLIEGGIHALLDRPRTLSGSHLFSSPSEPHLVLTEFLLHHSALMAIGMLIGAGFHRNVRIGALTAVLGALMLATAGFVVGLAGAIGPFLFSLPFPLPDFGSPLVGNAIVTSTVVWIALAALALAGCRLLTRDAPVR